MKGEVSRSQATPYPAARRSAPQGWSELAATYRPKVCVALEKSIVPFWWRAIDEERGGVFNCWNNAGTRLESRDKFTWSQGRFAWLWSRLAETMRKGLLPGEAARFLVHAEKTVEFLRAHAFLADGRCAFLLSEDGQVKEAVPGRGLAPSIYADCFVAMGFAEFARVSGERAALDDAWRVFESIAGRIEAGGFPTWPEPVPAGYSSHAIRMIFLNVSLGLHRASEDLGDTRAELAWSRSVATAARIFAEFVQPGGRIAELRPLPGGGGSEETLLSRHMNPGHTLEGLWLLLKVAVYEKREDWLARAAEAVRFAFERGWDGAHGGLLHFVDGARGAPAGVAGDSIYERGVRATWDTKLWWVHSEALTASLTSYRLAGDDTARAWFERTWEYALRVFPNPDVTVGEWIQIRNRRGEPLDRIVALPVKDPYHIARNLLQILEMLSEPDAVNLP
jgi:N-acylglucosamine 2-epimerase